MYLRNSINQCFQCQYLKTKFSVVNYQWEHVLRIYRIFVDKPMPLGERTSWMVHLLIWNHNCRSTLTLQNFHGWLNTLLLILSLFFPRNTFFKSLILIDPVKNCACWLLPSTLPSTSSKLSDCSAYVFYPSLGTGNRGMILPFVELNFSMDLYN